MLRYYKELHRSVIHTLNTMDTKVQPRRLFVFNHDTETEEQAFDASEDCSRSYDLSPDGRLLATGYWRNRGISVWDVDAGQLNASFGPTRVWSVHFDRTSSQLLVKAESGTAVYPVAPPHDSLPIKNAGKPGCGCFAAGENRYLFPSRRLSRSEAAIGFLVFLRTALSKMGLVERRGRQQKRIYGSSSLSVTKLLGMSSTRTPQTSPGSP